MSVYGELLDEYKHKQNTRTYLKREVVIIENMPDFPNVCFVQAFDRMDTIPRRLIRIIEQE